MLHDLFLDIDLSTISTSSSLFTWRRAGLETLLRLKRLDRCVVDTNWTLSFLNASVEILFNGCLDHKSLLLCYSNEIELHGSVPFRWYQAWSTNMDYQGVVELCWNGGNGGVVEALGRV